MSVFLHFDGTEVNHYIILMFLFIIFLPSDNAGCVVQSVVHMTQSARCPGFDTRSSHLLLFLFLLIQEGQLSVTGESMCTKYWLTAQKGRSLPKDSVVRLTDHPEMTIVVYRGCKAT